MWSLVAVLVLLVISSEAAPKPNYGSLSRYNNEEIGTLIDQKPYRNFDILRIGGGFGMAKRYENGEKHRRGPLNGLIPGGAFGRASRSNNQRFNELPSYDRFSLLYNQFDNFDDRRPIIKTVHSPELDTSNQYNSIDGE